MDDIDWTHIVQNVVYAAIILVITWAIAKAVRWGIGKLVSKIPMLQGEGGNGTSTGDSIGTIGALLIWLFGLVAVLEVFSLDAALSPIQDLLNTITRYLPNVIGAAIVFFIGFVIAKILKQLIETAVGMVKLGGVTSKMSKAGPTSESTGASSQHAAGQTPDAPTEQFSAVDQGGAATGSDDAGGSGMTSEKIATVVGNLVFIIVLILVTIAALQILDINVISDPAEHMLTLILGVIPEIIAAILILGIGYVIAKFIGPVLENILGGIGVDRASSDLGITNGDRSAATILTRLTQIAIMVFAAIMATESLGFPAATGILDAILALSGHVFFGAVIIIAGFFIATMVANALGEGTATTVVRYAVIVLFSAMGLKYMGIANSIIILAFGALVIGTALAGALAFGIGGRETAGRYLEERRAKKDEKKEGSSAGSPSEGSSS